VPEAPIEAPSPPLRLTAAAGNPLANAVSERKPDGKSHRQIKYQGVRTSTALETITKLYLP
jgi:hypothetical protein